MSTHHRLVCVTCEEEGPTARVVGTDRAVAVGPHAAKALLWPKPDARVDRGPQALNALGPVYWGEFLAEHAYHDLRLLTEGTALPWPT